MPDQIGVALAGAAKNLDFENRLGGLIAQESPELSSAEHWRVLRKMVGAMRDELRAIGIERLDPKDRPLQPRHIDQIRLAYDLITGVMENHIPTSTYMPSGDLALFKEALAFVLGKREGQALEEFIADIRKFLDERWAESMKMAYDRFGSGV